MSEQNTPNNVSSDRQQDLYGNDEVDLNEEFQEELEAPTEPAPAETTTPKAAEKAPSPPPQKIVQEPPKSQIPTYTSSDSPTMTAKSVASAYTQQAPQQIPTYEQPQPQDYRDSQHSRNQSIPVTERSVRPSEMKDEGKMFIGGLNWDTTDETLRDYFTQFGKVDACTIMRDAAGRSRCFAFLTFEDPASVNAVMVREHILDGKIIDPKRAIPRQEHQRATKLFIGGLPGSVTSESMREFFSQFGKVIDSTVMLDRETGRSKGFGFVSFENVDVTPYLGFGNLEIDGKLIDVKLAQPRYARDNQEEGGGQQNQGNTSFQAGNGSGQNRFANGGQQGNQFNGNMGGGSGGAGSGGQTPFDPQALAALYTRMMQMAGGGMNPGMMGGMSGGMNPMMGMGGAPGFGQGMRPGMGMGMGYGHGRWYAWCHGRYGRWYAWDG
ncbi:hypothetical protein NP233_g4994 [Leucocoprinus birnbaumii]|uniref:RRM domain-containing protein n=1 Tax=Leucocoprinus birnbaumii TaxID=56174 RepID=A0AAD5YRC6_9AGAR|nr:hypothetical protein NP233_g4994 [Leucocoprinus birnbaumii]